MKEVRTYWKLHKLRGKAILMTKEQIYFWSLVVWNESWEASKKVHSRKRIDDYKPEPGIRAI